MVVYWWVAVLGERGGREAQLSYDPKLVNLPGYAVLLIFGPNTIRIDKGNEFKMERKYLC